MSLLAAAGLAGSTTSAFALSEWTGATSTSWFVASNWLGGVPTAVDQVRISVTFPNVAIISAPGAVGDDVFVGVTGSGSLTVQSGGTLAAGSLVVSERAGAVGAVTVTGIGSSITSADLINIGQDAPGTLDIRSGGVVRATTQFSVGNVEGETSTINVDGVGSSAISDDIVVVGFRGIANVNLTNGGQMSSGLNVVIGSLGASTGTIVVDGAGSLLLGGRGITVGNVGTGFLTVRNGGRAASAAGVLGGFSGSFSGDPAATGNGLATITGAGSEWVISTTGNNAPLIIGNAGPGRLVVENGGRVRNFGSTTVGEDAGVRGEIALDGTDSFMGVTGSFTLGADGIGVLSIRNGASLATGNGRLGEDTGSDATAIIDGAGSLWTVNDTLTAGAGGSALVQVTNGGRIVGTSLNAGVFDSRGRVDVTGPGSLLQLNRTDGISVIGGTGDGIGALNVLDGGRVEVTDGLFLSTAENSRGDLTISGANSTVEVGDSFVMFESIANLTIADGGLLDVAGNSRIGLDPGQATALVTGAGSQWLGTTLNLGPSGAGGVATLSLEDGGLVAVDRTNIGSSANSTGIVNVDGAGSVFRTTGDAFSNGEDGVVVGLSGSGAINLTNGGVFRHVGTGGLLLGRSAGANGVINFGGAPGGAAVAAGVLETTSVTFGVGGGQVNFNHTGSDYAFTPVLTGAGAVNLLGGRTVLSAISTAFTGTSTLNGGDLRVTGTLGGDVAVQNGVLSGTGRVGDVSVSDTVAPGASIGTLTANGDVSFSIGSSFEIEADANGTADLFSVAGMANLLGGAVNVLTTGMFTTPLTYTILRAGNGLTGVFDSVADDNPFVDAMLSYDATSVFLTLTPTGTVPMGTLILDTVVRTVNGPDTVSALAVSRTVAQILTLPSGGGTIVLQLNDAGGTVVSGDVSGGAISAASAASLGQLSSGATPAGVNAPMVSIADPAVQTATGTIGTATVRRDDGITSTVTTSISVTQSAGAVVGGPANPTSCAQVVALSGTVTCTTTTTTTNSQAFTDVTFTDQAIVADANVRDVIALLNGFPAIIAELSQLLPDELPLAGLTPNQRAVAQNFNALAASNLLTGTALETVFDELSVLTGAAYATALDQLHPEPYDAFTQSAIAASGRWHDRVRGRMAAATADGDINAFSSARDGATGPLQGSAAPSLVGAWLSANAIRNDRDGDPGNIDATSTHLDIQGGFDAALSENFLGGVSVSFTRSEIDVDTRASGKLSNFQAGVYGAYLNGPWQANVGAAVGKVEADISRLVSFGTVNATPGASFDWWQWSAHGELSYRHDAGAAVLRPFVGLEAVGWNGYSVEETNGGAVGLLVTRGSDSRVSTRLGIEISTSIERDFGSIAPFASFDWTHHLSGTARTIDGRFLAQPMAGPGFTVSSYTPEDEFNVALGATVKMDGNVEFSAAYRTTLSDMGSSHGGQFQFLKRF